MAYPQYYYQPQYYPNLNQQMQQNPSNGNQTSGFVSVRNEMEARNYPVAYGNSVTFKDENAPYVYTKTMGFSQLETPRFEKYKLVKEEPVLTQEEPSTLKADKLPVYAEKSDIETLKAEIDTLKKEIAILKEGV